MCPKTPHLPSSQPVVGTALSPDGVQIQYLVVGSGPVSLVFVHGWGGNRDHWEQQIQYFASRYRVVTLDLAGHGRSGLERREWSIQAFAGDVTAVAAQLKLDRLVLVGHSMGGPVTLETALRLPASAVGLVGVDTFFDRWAKPTPQRRQWLNRFHTDFFTATRDWVTRELFLPDADPSLVARIAEDMAGTAPQAAIPAMEMLYRWGQTDFGSSLERLDIPLGMIQAEINTHTLDFLRAHAPTLPRFEISVLAEVGHYPMLEKPDDFNALLAGTVKNILQDPP